LLDTIAALGLETLDFATFPTRRFINAGGWDDIRYFKCHLKSMHEKGWIVWDDSRETGKWVIKLTAAGKKATSEIAPEALWEMPWDGKWRLIGFDLPATEQKLRRQLLLWLKSNRFGCLQHSLWITPLPEKDWHDKLSKLGFDPSGVTFVEGVSFAKSSNRDFVKRAWDYDTINRRYQTLIDFHKRSKIQSSRSVPKNWAKEENKLWRDAIEIDPLLPKTLHPRQYLGPKAHATRTKSFGTVYGP
jgi:DNA-binding transcriptional regulator PaaX